MNKVFICFGVLAAFLVVADAKIEPENLRCLVCRKTIEELEKAIMNVDPRKTVEVGNYRLDGAGNIHQNRVPLAKSQIHLSELLDDVCKKMTDYVRVRYKATQKLAIMKMMSETGGMNPEFSHTDFVTDDDLNKSLEYYCEGIVGEHEDFIVELYSKREDDSMPDGTDHLCKRQMKLCEDWMLPNASDLTWNAELERERGGDPYGFGNMQPPPSSPFGEDSEELDVGELEMDNANDRVEL